MTFETTVNGIPCQCLVYAYAPARPMIIYGSGWGDCHPPEPEYFEYNLLDRRGRKAPWLERYITPEVNARLMEEYLAIHGQESYA
jgi:hypothetical protein